jgi:hypothetical protein
MIINLNTTEYNLYFAHYFPTVFFECGLTFQLPNLMSTIHCLGLICKLPGSADTLCIWKPFLSATSPERKGSQLTWMMILLMMVTIRMMTRMWLTVKTFDFPDSEMNHENNQSYVILQ